MNIINAKNLLWRHDEFVLTHKFARLPPASVGELCAYTLHTHTMAAIRTARLERAGSVAACREPFRVSCEFISRNAVVIHEQIVIIDTYD